MRAHGGQVLPLPVFWGSPVRGEQHRAPGGTPGGHRPPSLPCTSSGGAGAAPGESVQTRHTTEGSDAADIKSCGANAVSSAVLVCPGCCLSPGFEMPVAYLL